MGISLKITGSFTDSSLPVVGYDAMLNGGTKFLMDLANPNLYPAQNATFVGAINGVPGGETITKVGGGGTAPTFSGGGYYLPSGAGGTPGLRSATGSGCPYDLTKFPDTDEWLFTLWYKQSQAATDGNTRNLFGIADAASGAAQQFGITDTYASANGIINLRVAGVSLTGVCSGPVVGIGQVAIHMRSDASNRYLTCYRDGARVNQVTTPKVAFLALSSGALYVANAVSLSGVSVPTERTFYRASVENITQSQRDPAQQVAKDFALNTGRFA